MSYVALAAVKHRMSLGRPLPFHVRDADHTLLLARGHVLETEAQLRSLLERGALVDSDELPANPSPVELISQAPPEQLPALWGRVTDLAHAALNNPDPRAIEAAIDHVTEPLLAIVERDPDLAIFQVLRQQGGYLAQYGINHSLHCAITTCLVATRLGWAVDDVRRAFKAALTMNLSMLSLQGELATQPTPLTDAQRACIHSHPLRSVALLEQAGVSDPDWLRAVAQHHEESDGSGYTSGTTDISELAGLLHRSDVYTAKLSPRSNRAALSADVAARMVFASDRGHPATAAIVKEFGLYPPGCPVRLVSGEAGIVVRRGSQAHTPVVAVTHGANVRPLREPLRRDTAQPANRIAQVLHGRQLDLHVTPQALQRVAWA